MSSPTSMNSGPSLVETLFDSPGNRAAGWRTARRYSWVIVGFALLFAVLGAGLQLSRSNGYVATTRVFANTKQSDVPVSQSATVAVQRMQSYVRLVGSSRLAKLLIDDLGLTENANQLASRMSATLDQDTVVMTVTVIAPTSEDARRISKALPGQFTDMINSLNDVASRSTSATDFTIVNGPVVHRNFSLVKVAAAAVFGLLMGAAIGLALSTVLVRRRAVGTPEYFARTTGLAVVGIVPKPAARRFYSASPDEKDEARLREATRLANLRVARNLSLATRSGQQVVVISGVDETTDTSSMSVVFAKNVASANTQVLLIDADFTDGHLPVEISSRPRRGTTLKLIQNRVQLDVAVARTATNELALLDLGEGSAWARQAYAGERLTELMSQARTSYDLVVIHAAPVLSTIDLPTATDDANLVVLVVEADTGSADRVHETVRALRGTSEAEIVLVVRQPVKHGELERRHQLGIVLPPHADPRSGLSATNVSALRRVSS